jgi:aspartate carbamoyltransferase regulatory subunit
MENRSRSVPAIDNGTVIDHIQAGYGLKIIDLLKINDGRHVVTIGLNLESKLIGHKDIIKITGRHITPEEANQIAILSPEATINIVRNFRVESKYRVQAPDMIARIVVCPNSRCISNCSGMESRFEVQNFQGTLWLRCHYCEKSYSQSEIKGYRR